MANSCISKHGRTSHLAVYETKALQIGRAEKLIVQNGNGGCMSCMHIQTDRLKSHIYIYRRTYIFSLFQIYIFILYYPPSGDTTLAVEDMPSFLLNVSATYASK